MAIYSDPGKYVNLGVFTAHTHTGYALSARLFMPFPDGRFDALHSAFNQSMSSNRISVEWGYGRTRNLWRALNLSSELQIFKSPIAAWYVCAVLFTNAVTCIEGNNVVSEYFGCPPPTLIELFRTLRY